MSTPSRTPLLLSVLLFASTAGAEDAALSQPGGLSTTTDDAPEISLQIAASESAPPPVTPAPAAPDSGSAASASATAPAAAPPATPPATDAPAAAAAPGQAAPGAEQVTAEQVIMSEPALLPGISYEEALEQIEEWQAYIASQHEAMRKQADERRARLEQRREEMIAQAKERQEKMIEYYESMYKKAQEQRKFLEENEEDFMKDALERQSGLSEYHDQMRKTTEERRAELAAKRAELENMPLQDIRTYLAEVRKQTLEDAKSLHMEGVRTPTPPPWPDAPAYESRQGPYGYPGRGWQGSNFGPAMDYPMGPPSELGNPPFGDWGPRGGYPKGGFGGPGMRRGPGGHPGMRGPGMMPPGGPGPQSSIASPPPATRAIPAGAGPQARYQPAMRSMPVARDRLAPRYMARHGFAPRGMAPSAWRAYPGRTAPRHMAAWRPVAPAYAPGRAPAQTAWWPAWHVPPAVVATSRFGTHPFPAAYSGPRGPMQAGAYPARQVVPRYSHAAPGFQQPRQHAPSFALAWPQRPYTG